MATSRPVSTSPGRPSRPSGVYVPRHRRTTEPDEGSRGQPDHNSSNATPKSDSESGIIRRGRGTFEAAPTSHGSVRRTEGLKSARDFDATSLRQYPPDRPERLQGGSPRHDRDLGVLSGRLSESLRLGDDNDRDGSWEDLLDDSSTNEVKNGSSLPSSRPSSAKKPSWGGSEDAVALECSGFPAAWKTYHLEDAFSEGGVDRDSFRIRWVNDTSALIVFRTTAAGGTFPRSER